MNITKKNRSIAALQRGRFVLCRAFDVLHVYRHSHGGCRLVASIQARGGRGQVQFSNDRRHPFEITSALQALQLLRVMRRFG